MLRFKDFIKEQFSEIKSAFTFTADATITIKGSIKDSKVSIVKKQVKFPKLEFKSIHHDFIDFSESDITIIDPDFNNITKLTVNKKETGLDVDTLGELSTDNEVLFDMDITFKYYRNISIPIEVGDYLFTDAQINGDYEPYFKIVIDGKKYEDVILYDKIVNNIAPKFKLNKDLQNM